MSAGQEKKIDDLEKKIAKHIEQHRVTEKTVRQATLVAFVLGLGIYLLFKADVLVPILMWFGTAILARNVLPAGKKWYKQDGTRPT